MANRGDDICARTFAFATDIVQFCRSIDQTERALRPLVGQLMRAGTSIGANVEEAQGGQSRADFLSKMQIARKEARETLYWLRLMEAAGIAKADEVAALRCEASELVAILTSIVKRTQAPRS